MDQRYLKRNVKHGDGVTKTTKAERRKKFDKFKDTLHSLYGNATALGGLKDTKPKVMSNTDRRKLGIEEDPALEDYQGEKT